MHKGWDEEWAEIGEIRRKSRGYMKEELEELFKYREILYMIAYRDIKIRYIQSIMGFLWAILMPIVIVMSGVIVRYAFSIVSHSPMKTADIASVAVKSVPWAFVVSSIRFSCYSLTSNYSLVTKIYFPKEIFPMAAVLASLFDFSIAFSALIILLVLMKIGISIYLLWVPVLLATIVLFCLGIGMLVSASSLFFRDVKYIVEILLTFGIFFTPVFYDVRMFGSYGKLLLLNPLAPLFEGLSTCIVSHASPDVHWYLYSLTFSLTFFVAGFLLFKHLEPAFAESI
jgi:lipopolysaccharide transport system permease protein